MKVLKFGGSSVATPERLSGVADILQRNYTRGEAFTAVVSAFGGITDQLIAMGRHAEEGNESYRLALEAFKKRHRDAALALLSGPILETALSDQKENHDLLENLLYGIFLVREASPRTMDYVLSFGERNSAYLLAKVLEQRGMPAKYLDARKIIKTDKRFGKAGVNFELTNSHISQYYSTNPGVHIVTGFIASTKYGLTTTLGRGGSDYTAAILGAGLRADAIEIWTDVDGVMTADPRLVKKAFSLPNMTYAEAMEMSHFGAKVIYPPTIRPAMDLHIPLYIKNTFKPDFAGTLVSKERDPDGPAVKGISSINDVALLTLSGSGMFGVPGVAARLFGILAQADINIILITQGSSEHSISFAVTPKDSQKAKRLIDQAFASEMEKGFFDAVKVEKELSVIAIIGENMSYRPGIAGRLFHALGSNGINVVAIAQGSSELNISVVINRADEVKALNAVHEAFFLSDTKALHVFVVGVGLIGGTLLRQMHEQAEYLKQEIGLEIKIVGLANSKRMHFNAEGIALHTWAEQLAADHNAHFDMAKFVSQMSAMNLPNSIFVDNTASADIAAFYDNILNLSISISTPNKIATSSGYLQYQRLKQTAKRRGVAFMYETNVGAGLPIISTINDLKNSGDKIHHIEAVLSGSLSYIFNSFDASRPFSAIVAEARDRGYTEPDPRIDLSGLDVRRKLLILARESGLPLEAEAVRIHPILSDEIMKLPDVDSFWESLPEEDDSLAMKMAAAQAEDKVLRLIARLDVSKGEASIGLQAVDKSSPFYFLSGSDNMIMFTTQRYKERPLIIRGPGAGAEVTAAGIFAEIITIANLL